MRTARWRSTPASMSTTSRRRRGPLRPHGDPPLPLAPDTVLDPAKDGTAVTIRPIKPEDAELEIEFVRKLSPETKYYRFMNTMRELSPAMVARLTQIDYDREMAFVATLDDDGSEKEIGVCRYAVNPDGESCEFAVVVADDWQGTGPGAQADGRAHRDRPQPRHLRYMNGDVPVRERRACLPSSPASASSSPPHPEDPGLKRGVLAKTTAAPTTASIRARSRATARRTSPACWPMPGIVRNRLKVCGEHRQCACHAGTLRARRQPRQPALAIRRRPAAHQPLGSRCPRFRPSRRRAEAMSKELKRRGFRFIGPTVMYAHMQATGMVNDHLASCPRHAEVMR
jgi:hypothetical protein